MNLFTRQRKGPVMPEQESTPTMPTIEVAGVEFGVMPFKPEMYVTRRGQQTITVAADMYDWWTGCVQEGKDGAIVYVTEKYPAAVEVVDGLTVAGYLP